MTTEHETRDTSSGDSPHWTDRDPDAADRDYERRRDDETGVLL